MASSSIDDVLRDIDEWRHGKLWGLKAIAAEAGRSTRTIARWEQLSDCPITIVNGRFFVLRLDLILWMTGKNGRFEAEMSEHVLS